MKRILQCLAILYRCRAGGTERALYLQTIVSELLTIIIKGEHCVVARCIKGHRVEPGGILRKRGPDPFQEPAEWIIELECGGETGASHHPDSDNVIPGSCKNILVHLSLGFQSVLTHLPVLYFNECLCGTVRCDEESYDGNQRKA